jgi:hypothetical protein
MKLTGTILHENLKNLRRAKIADDLYQHRKMQMGVAVDCNDPRLNALLALAHEFGSDFATASELLPKRGGDGVNDAEFDARVEIEKLLARAEIDVEREGAGPGSGQ